MDETTEKDAGTFGNLAEERMRLEREALQLERERLEAARAHAAAEARLSVRAHHPFLAVASVALLTLLAFAGGLMTGVAVMENRQQRQREERLAKALSQLDGLTGGVKTNSVALPSNVREKSPDGAHRNVAVVVIQ